MRITRIRITEQEQQVIKVVIKFANLKKIASARQVEKLFEPLSVGVFKSISTINPKGEPYRNDQTQIRDWLLSIVEQKNNDLPDSLNKMLSCVDAGLTYRSGRLQYQFGFSGVQAVSAFGVALILDEGRGLTTRLGYCKAPGCGRFRLDFEGKPRFYCDDDHKRLYDKSKSAERVRAWRKRQK